MLQMQQEDGRIPEEIFWSERTAEENALILLQYSNTRFTDTTQMPVLPFSLKSIYEKSKNKLVLKEFLYPLINYMAWWRNTRDLGDGLVIAIHNWETGLDASPAYDPAYHVYITQLNETALHSLYPKFIELVESYRFLYKWNVSEILHRAQAPEKPSRLDTWFMVKDVGLNSVYAAGWGVLGDLALELGDHSASERCYEEMRKTSSAILDKMFIPAQGRFNTLYIDSDGQEKASVANTVQNLFPLLLRDLPAQHVDRIEAELRDENKFNGPFAVPTVALDDPQFSATFDVDLMWRGPVWGFTNWFVLEGLGVHHRLDTQVQLTH
jgi:hypothetical protein